MILSTITTFFSTSSRTTLLDLTLETTSEYIVASTVVYRNHAYKNKYLRIKVVNFDGNPHHFRFSINGLDSKVQASRATTTMITGPNEKEENCLTKQDCAITTKFLYLEHYVFSFFNIMYFLFYIYIEFVNILSNHQ